MIPIVIPLHPGGGKFKNDTELRFALRSIEKHFKDDCEIIIAGRKVPKWARNVRHIKTEGLKSTLNVVAKEFPDGFFWFYDDTCLLKDITAKEMKVTTALRNWSKAQTGWARQLDEVKARLVKEGIPAIDFSRPHGPYWFDKAMVDEGFVDWPGMAGKFPWESWILSKRDWPRRTVGWKQYYGAFTVPGDFQGHLNYNDNGNTPELRAWLAERFPEASQYEKAVPKVEPLQKPLATDLRNLRYVYINMDRDAARRESFLREFPGVDWWRFPGCEGGLMWGEVARGLGMLGNLRSSADGNLSAPRWGTFGCSLSHVLCLKMATIADGIVLFPDDVTNAQRSNLKDLVALALANRPDGVGWIKLKNHKPLYDGAVHQSGGWTFRKLAKVRRDVTRKRSFNTGSAAVIILKEQAKAILSALPALTSNHIDFELRAIVDQVPGGCWEMMDTGIRHASADGDLKGSVREQINRERAGR